MGSTKRRKNATAAASSAVNSAKKSRKKQKTTNKTEKTNSIDSPEIIPSNSEILMKDKEDTSTKKRKFVRRKKKTDDEIQSEDSSYQLAPLPDFSYNTRLSTFKIGVIIQKKSASKKKTTTSHFYWTKETPSCEELSKNGFFFTPSDEYPDCITCIYCNEKIHDLDTKQNNNTEIMDDGTLESPILRHIKTSANCSFAKLLVTKFLKTHSISFDWESYPILNNPFSKDSINMRLDTFKRFNWPYDSETNSNNLPKSDKLAKAGFYYDPHKSTSSHNNRPDDTVTCVYCNVSLQDWEEDDDPMAEHKNISPHCYLYQYDTKSKMKNQVHNSNKSVSPNNSRRNSFKRKSIVLSKKKNSSYGLNSLSKIIGNSTYTNRRRSSIISINDTETDKGGNKEPFSDEVVELSENDINTNKIHSGMDLIENKGENDGVVHSNNVIDKENDFKEELENANENENRYESILDDISIHDIASDSNVDNNDQNVIIDESDNEATNLQNVKIRSDPLQEEIVDIDSIEDEIEKENIKNSSSATYNNHQSTSSNTPDASSLNIPTKTLSDLNNLWFIEDNSSSRPATMFSSGKARLSMYDIKSSKLEISNIPAKVRSSLRPKVRSSSTFQFNGRNSIIDVSQSLAASSPIKNSYFEDKSGQRNAVEPMEQVEQEQQAEQEQQTVEHEEPTEQEQQPVEREQVLVDDGSANKTEVDHNVDDIEVFQYVDDAAEDHKGIYSRATPDPFTKMDDDDNNNEHDNGNDAYDNMNVDYDIVDNDPIDNEVDDRIHNEVDDHIHNEVNHPIEDAVNENMSTPVEEKTNIVEINTNVEIEETPKPRKRGRPPKKKRGYRGKYKSNSEETENKIEETENKVEEIANDDNIIEEDINSASIPALETEPDDKNEITGVSVHESIIYPPEIEVKELGTVNDNAVFDKAQKSSFDSSDISNSDAHDIKSSHDSSSSFRTQGNKRIIQAKYVSKVVKRGRIPKNARRIVVNGQLIGSDDLLNPSSSSNTPFSLKPSIKNKKLKVKEKSQNNVNILTNADHGNTDSGSLLGSNNFKNMGMSKLKTDVNNSDKENNFDLYNRDSRGMITEISDGNDIEQVAESDPVLAVDKKSLDDRKIVNSDDDILLEDEDDDEIDSRDSVGGTKLKVDKQVYSDAKTLSPVGIKSFSKFSSRSGSQKSNSGDDNDNAKVLDLNSIRTGYNNPLRDEVLDKREMKLPSDEFIDSEVSADNDVLEKSDEYDNELTIRETINKEIQNRKKAVNSLTPIKFDPSSSPYAEEKLQKKEKEVKTTKNIKTDDRSPSDTAAGLFPISENGNVINKVKLFPSSPDILLNRDVPIEFGEESSRLVNDRESSSSFDPTTRLDLQVFKPEENHKSDKDKLLWESPNYEEVKEQVGQLTVATQFFKEIANSEYNSLNDDLDGMLTNFISEMPKQELEMTIQEWIKHSAKQAGKIVEEKCENMINMLKIEQDKALDILNRLPVSDGL
ncbi:hypothetical protein B5S30_g3666 [[Candida] boidinii]|nr:hypothetical protein B5S30_g3666 [[Candida] boidinii]